MTSRPPSTPWRRRRRPPTRPPRVTLERLRAPAIRAAMVWASVTKDVESGGAPFTNDGDFVRQESIRWSDPRDPAPAIRQMGGQTKSPRAAHPHPLDSVEETGKQALAIDPQAVEQCSAVVPETSTPDDTPRPTPANRVTTAEPHAQAKVI